MMRVNYEKYSQERSLGENPKFVLEGYLGYGDFEN